MIIFLKIYRKYFFLRKESQLSMSEGPTYIHDSKAKPGFEIYEFEILG